MKTEMKEVIMIKIIFPSSFLMKTLPFMFLLNVFVLFLVLFERDIDPGCEARPAQLERVSSFDIFFDTIKSIVIQHLTIFTVQMGGNVLNQLKNPSKSLTSRLNKMLKQSLAGTSFSISMTTL